MNRCLIVGIPTVVFVGLLGFWGYLEWSAQQSNRPEAVLASARAGYRQGMDYLKNSDDKAATPVLQAADASLKRLLAPDRDPSNGAALILRYRILNQLAGIAARVEATKRTLPSGERSDDFREEARRIVERAAQDPKNAEAQAAMLEILFARDAIDSARVYADNLLQNLPASPPEGIDLHPNIMGAHFVLARAALRRDPPQLDEVIEHVRASDELQKKWVAAQSRPAEMARTRWRMVHLYAQALTAKAKQTTTGQRELQDRMAEWLTRVRKEAQPASGAEPGASPLVGMSRSDLVGLCDFLALSVEQAYTSEDVIERLQIMLDVWQAAAQTVKPAKLAPYARRELALRYQGWPELINRIAEGLRPSAREWAQLYQRLEATGLRLCELGVGLEPEAVHRMMQHAESMGQQEHLEGAMRLANVGLKVCALERSTPDAQGRLKDLGERELELHRTAAWLSLLLKKPTAFEEHLDFLREHPDKAYGWLHLIQGLGSLESGQLEKGLADIYQSRRQFTGKLTIILAQAYLNAGLGRFEQALPDLESLEAGYYAAGKSMPREQEMLAERLGMDRKSIVVELLRCQLALGNLEKARRYRELLRGEPEWITTGIIVVRHLIGLGPTAADRLTYAVRTPSKEAIDEAGREMNELRKAAPRDARLLLVEAELLSSPSSDTTSRADAFLREKQTSWPGDPDEAQLVWAAWLLRTGRIGEAEAVLARLENVAPAEVLKRRISRLRYETQVARQPAFVKADTMIRDLGLLGDAAASDLYVAGWEAAISVHESAGYRLYWRGQLALTQGDLETAADLFGRALAFGTVRPAARRCLLATVLQWRDKDPVSANALVLKLIEATRMADAAAATLRLAPLSFDPVALLAFVETVRTLDNIDDAEGIPRGFKALDALMDRRTSPSANALALYEARIWLAADRPDRAAEVLQRSRTINTSSVPFLLLAGPIDRASQDWNALLRHGETLTRIKPELPEGFQWMAEASAQLGDRAAAEKSFRELTTRFPNSSEGYRGLVNLRERNRDFAGALTEVALWKNRVPVDVQSLQAEVRVLARLGRIKDAQQAGERSSKTGNETTLAVARGFYEAQVFGEALAWATRAAESARKTNDTERRLQARFLLGEICRAQGKAATDADARRNYVNQAIDHYREVFQEAPGQTEAGLQLAYLLVVERNEPAAAFAVVQRLRQMRNGTGLVKGDRLPLDVLELLGTIYLPARLDNDPRQGEHARDAREVFDEASNRYKNEPIVFYNLGRAQAMLGEKLKAVANLNLAAHLADDKYKQARDPEEKSRWQDLAHTARDAEKEIRRGEMDR